MIHIPVAVRNTVIITGAVLKEVHCEHCGSEYVYQMARQAAGAGTNILFLDQRGAVDRATKRAQTDLQRLLKCDCDPVPCPNCGKYQTHMYPAARRSYQRWMLRWGQYSLVLCGVCLGITWLCSINKRFPVEPDTLGSLWGITIAAGVVSLVLIGGRKLLAAMFDPNMGDDEPRKLLGQSLALLKAKSQKLS
jgi:hypothetical protein